MTELAYKWIGGDLPPCSGIMPRDCSADTFKAYCDLFGAEYVAKFFAPRDGAAQPTTPSTGDDEE